jgi:cellulose synthase (UDP-forming)
VDPVPTATRTYSIDVLIPTMGEPIHVLRRTIKAAVGMDLPHRTLVLDDAGRPEVEHLAKRLGAEYQSRPPLDRGGAKAGNLNHALRRTSGELFAVFDADHVPRHDFLRWLVGYFEDQNIAFVQTPQYYGNSTDNRVARGAYQQQAIFYGPICRGKNGLDSAFCCGTNVLFRRTAIEDVGGFDERSVVEDFVTSMRVHRKGWSSVYFPYVLAVGMGPTNLTSYFRQQFRWARGSVGAFASLEPFKRGFSLAQRFQYLLATTFYLIGAVTSIYVVLPIVYLFTGWSAFSASSGTFVFFYFPYLFLGLLTVRWGLGGRLRVEHLQFTFGMFPVYAVASISAILHLPARFLVTGTSDSDARRRPPALAWVTISSFVATIVAIGWGLVRRDLDPRTFTNISWAIVNLLLCSGIVRAAYRELRGMSHAQARRPQPERLEPVAGGRSLEPFGVAT